MQDGVFEKVQAAASEILAYADMELVHAEMRRESGGLILRLYIDKEGGVTLEDCAQISRLVSAQLDTEDLIAESYTLEVSSPGLDRPLARESDFKRFAGHNVRLSTVAPLEGRRHFTGRLVGIADGTVHLVLEGGQAVSIPRDQIDKARLQAELNGFGTQPGAKGRHA
jgi:ribosome maturation factor RimP